jgi:gluconate 5-dehydrogenase
MNVRQLLELGGKHALVTGGSRGLGLQIAEALGEMGARVAITARKQQELDQAIAHLKRAGIQCDALVCDLGKRDAIVPLADEVLRRYGRVEILVNNADAT